MNLIDAIKSGRPYRRQRWDFGVWRNPPDETRRCEHYGERLVDLLADDWEIEEPTVTITRTQYWDAVANAMKKCPIVINSDYLVNKIAIELGFGVSE